MARLPRTMRLTEAHVQKVHRDIADPGAATGLVEATADDIARFAENILGGAPEPTQVWLFAYGSLLWKPACESVEMRTGTLRGWHRAFCLGWNTRWRGSVENPGLMLALDRGGSCNGVLYRLPPDAVTDNLKLVCKREMGFMPSPFPPRWVTVATEAGPLRAFTFCIDRNSGRYINGLDEFQVADVLAKAVGARGSMTEYLYLTVKHLEDMGVHDSHLWRLQELVAERIDALSAA